MQQLSSSDRTAASVRFVDRDGPGTDHRDPGRRAGLGHVPLLRLEPFRTSGLPLPKASDGPRKSSMPGTGILSSSSGHFAAASQPSRAPIASTVYVVAPSPTVPCLSG